MAQNTETVLSQLTALSTNALSVILGVGSGVLTSTTQSPHISVTESLGTIYYAGLGGAASYCVKLLIEGLVRQCRTRWLQRAAIGPATGPLLGLSPSDVPANV